MYLLFWANLQTTWKTSFFSKYPSQSSKIIIQTYEWHWKAHLQSRIFTHEKRKKRGSWEILSKNAKKITERKFKKISTVFTRVWRKWTCEKKRWRDRHGSKFESFSQENIYNIEWCFRPWAYHVHSLAWVIPFSFKRKKNLRWLLLLIVQLSYSFKKREIRCSSDSSQPDARLSISDRRFP